MDLADDPSQTPKPESFMRRFRKLFVFVGACALALVISVYNRGDELTVGANAPLRAAVTAPQAAYDLSQLPIFTRSLFHVRESYFDKNRLNPKRMLVGALDFLQRDVPEILIDRGPERDPKTVKVRVNGKEKAFSLDGVDAPWSLRSKLQEIFKFIQPNLHPVAPSEEGRRLVEIESAATNGMLYTLDPHSVLLDVESFKDMRMTTQGKFGGLGIVIGMDKKSRVVVRKPMPNTPAMRAGLKAKDQIVRINDESTVNMALTDAVERLRGDVGSPVDVYIVRDGAKTPKKFTIVRDAIRPPSIDPPAQVLNAPAKNGQPGGKVGYVRIQSFTANTDADLAKALEMFEKEKVKGIIMDLRWNPGGLYDQAQKVADAFIESGVVVSMVGVGGTQRRDEHASRGGDVKAPVAVLVNQSSASASEIVAGAMKHLDRGVVIGDTTFGKGSVQMLFDVNSPVKLGNKSGDDKLGLKLTTAQYLTAGDISIQGVGVTPDIELDRLYVQKTGDESRIMLQPSAHRRQESDYEWHLDNPTATKAEQPMERVSFLYEPNLTAAKQAEMDKAATEEEEEAIDDEATMEDDEDYAQYEKLNVDFSIEFARDFLAQAKSSRRTQLVKESKAFLEQVRAEQDAKVAEALSKLGVDWSAGSGSQPLARLAATLEVADGKPKVNAGDRVKLRGTVKNLGKTTAYRVRAVLKSEDTLFDENEMVFGKIEPGQSKSYDLNVRVPKSMATRADYLRAEVSAQGAVEAEAGKLALDIVGRARPLFAYNYQTIDDGEGANQDGRVQIGEKLRMLVKVKNIGAGTAMRPQAIIRNGPGQNGILISKGRFEGKDLGPGKEWPVSFSYEVGPEFQGKDYSIELSVVDRVLGESVTDKIVVHVAAEGRPTETATGTATVAKTVAMLRESPVEGSLVVGQAPKGASFAVSGRLGSFTRVVLEEGHPAFVSTSDLQSGGTVTPKYEPVWQVTPPILAVSAPTTVNSASVTVKGEAKDDKQVRDVFISVWNRDAKMPARKVFYLRNESDPKKVNFSADVPLWPGSNLIQVFARETNEVQSLQTLVVRRAEAPMADAAAH
ncbi:MAG: MXAN_5808 family serine peptidase [Deltaproteobacteria bacterium]|nr:MXAN_5808 family serine peptidase [Deltaproteobacteria bacterium]